MNLKMLFATLAPQLLGQFTNLYNNSKQMYGGSPQLMPDKLAGGFYHYANMLKNNGVDVPRSILNDLGNIVMPDGTYDHSGYFGSGTDTLMERLLEPDEDDSDYDVNPSPYTSDPNAPFKRIQRTLSRKRSSGINIPPIKGIDYFPDIELPF